MKKSRDDEWRVDGTLRVDTELVRASMEDVEREREKGQIRRGSARVSVNLKFHFVSMEIRRDFQPLILGLESYLFSVFLFGHRCSLSFVNGRNSAIAAHSRLFV